MTSSKNHLTELLSSSVLIVVGVAVASIGRMVERIVIAQQFSPGLYGEVTIGFAIMTLGTTVSLVGMNDGIPRFISRFDDERDVRGVYLVGLIVSVAVSLLVTAVLFTNIEFIVDTFFETESSTALLRLFILTIPVSVSLTVGVSTLRGLENTRYKLYTKDLLHPGLRILFLAVLLTAGFDLLSVGYAYFVATLGALVVVAFLSHRLIRLVGPIRSHARELLTFSAPLIVTMVLSLLLTQMDTLMLAHFKSSESVGLYNAAYPLANSLLLIISSFGYLYLPLTSRLDADGEREEITEIYQLTTKWIFVITFPAFLLFTAFSDDVLSILYGADYASGGIALTILSIGFFTDAAAGRNRGTLAALGYTTAILWSDVLTLALNFVMNLVLIPRYGFVGAAVASASAYVVRNAALNVMLHAKCDISPLSRHTKRTYVILPVVLLPLGFVASAWLTLTTFTLPVVLVLAGLVALVAVALAGGLQPEDATLVEFVEGAVGVDIPVVGRYLRAQGE